MADFNHRVNEAYQKYCILIKRHGILPHFILIDSRYLFLPQTSYFLTSDKERELLIFAFNNYGFMLHQIVNRLYPIER